MSLIPSELRSSPSVTSDFRTVEEAWAENPNALTLGVAAISQAASLLKLGAFRAASAAYAACAIAVTRLENRGSRIYGVPCVGVGSVATPPKTWWIISAAAGTTILWTNPFSKTVTVRVWANSGYGGGASVVLTGFTFLSKSSVPYDPNPGNLNGNYSMAPGATIKSTGGIYGVFGGVELISADEALDWKPAVYSLEWVTAGVSWWGGADLSARAGIWVRRSSWTDADRKIRFEAGAGTSRAVAVQIVGGSSVAERVTKADFGKEEFLADDWQIDSSAEPAKIDVTDLSFSGAGIYFSVGPAGPVDPNPPVVPTPDPVVNLPIDGKGFLYLKNGAATLVPARDVTGADWQP